MTTASSSRFVAHPVAVVLLVWTGLFMTTLDASIVNIGLPAIARAFQTPLSGTIEWVIIGYLVVTATLLLTVGRLSDLVGRTPIWTAGLVLFTLASLVCGAAPALGLLIAARLVQGAGASLILATGTAMLTDAVPPDFRGRALGMGALVIALGTSVGPTLGGVITEHLSWRWIFYVNLPVGLVALVAARRFLPRGGGRGDRHFDPLGAVLLAIGVAALTLGLSFGGEWGWTSVRLLGTLGVGVVALTGALLTESRVAHPIIHLTMFRNPVFASAIASMLMSMLALFLVGFLLPFYFEELRLDTTSSTWDIVWRLGLAGLGQRLFQAPNTRALMEAAPAASRERRPGCWRRRGSRDRR